jgi:hypothetical protein
MKNLLFVTALFYWVREWCCQAAIFQGLHMNKNSNFTSSVKKGCLLNLHRHPIDKASQRLQGFWCKIKVITLFSGSLALCVLSAIHRRRFLEKKTNDAHKGSDESPLSQNRHFCDTSDKAPETNHL